jgi:hypothetical protein
MTQLGKYSTDRDNILHYMATSDWANDSFGDVEAPTGYVWRISNTLEEVQLSNTELTSLIEEQVKAYGIEDNDDFRHSLVGHFLLVEGSQGFVDVYAYDSEAELLKEYDYREEVYSEWAGDEES